MNLRLERTCSTPYGVFGRLLGEDGEQLMVTLEHSYGGQAKLAPGEYRCVRHAPNRLPYETFMVTGVPDFQGQRVDGILIHIGNFNRDSEGCVLVGLSEGVRMILSSHAAFERLMGLQAGLQEFRLTVAGLPQ